MPRNIDDEDDEREWDGEHWDDYEPDEPADDEDDVGVPCPHCGESVYEDAERCPHCERYLSREDAPAVRKPVWIIIGFLAVMAVVYIWIRFND